MVGKNNQYVKEIKQGTKVETYSIKKFKVGIASVAIGCSVFFGAGAVAMAGEQAGAPVLTGESNTTVVPKGEERAITGNQSATEAQSKPTPAKEGKIEPEKPKATVNKAKLETLIKEVEGLNLEKYTEESVKGLKTELAKAKEVFETAQNKEEVEAAWRTLFTYKNSKLVVKKTPKLSQDNTPKPDTTNGKETVGINAENTEPNGTNIVGHNHSMNGTTRSEGSGFRAVPAGDAYFNLDSGTLETEVGSAPNAKFLVVWRKKQGYKPQLTSDGLGIRLVYDRQIPDNDFVKRLFNTTGSINVVGSYDVAFEMKDGSSGVVYEKKSFKVSVKPLAPRVTVENLENAAGTRAKVTATARNPQYSSGEQPGDSSVDFYVNGVKKQTVTAVNGVAEWTPTEVFNVNDRITATNTARDKQFLPSRGTNINVPITATTSNMSSEVVIPRPVTPTVNKDALRTATTTGDTETKATAAYYNAEASKKAAYDQAVTAGKAVLARDNATQTEVNDAVSAINTAKNNLGGVATNKDALRTATSTGDTETKATAAYYNAEASKKTAYDNAVASGKTIFNKADATQTEVDNAVSAITNAKNALGGVATNKDALRTATTTGDTETKATAAYYNAEASKKAAYDQAVTAGKVVLAKDNATQTEVNDAVNAINAVKEKLDGAPFPTEIEKSNAIEEVKKALDTKVKSIESSKEFTDNDKGILKDKAEKAAMTAIVKIKTATTNAAVETAKTEGIERINSVEARLAAKLEVPELIITKWQDEAGNDLRPADAKAPAELGEANEALAHGGIPGYEYVVTKTDKENVVVTHIFRKLPKKDRTFPEKPKTSNPNKADESQSPAKENVSMKSNLPNTGVTGTNSGLAGLGLAMFGGLLTVARQRRRNK